MLKILWISTFGLLTHVMLLLAVLELLNQPSTAAVIGGIVSGLLTVTADVLLVRGYTKWRNKDVVSD